MANENSSFLDQKVSRKTLLKYIAGTAVVTALGALATDEAVRKLTSSKESDKFEQLQIERAKTPTEFIEVIDAVFAAMRKAKRVVANGPFLEGSVTEVELPDNKSINNYYSIDFKESKDVEGVIRRGVVIHRGATIDNTFVKDDIIFGNGLQGSWMIDKNTPFQAFLQPENQPADPIQMDQSKWQEYSGIIIDVYNKSQDNNRKSEPPRL